MRCRVDRTDPRTNAGQSSFRYRRAVPGARRRLVRGVNDTSMGPRFTRVAAPLVTRSRWAACSRSVKIRDGLARDSYADPGPYKNPPGTVAYEIDAPDAEPPRQGKPKEATKPAEMKGMKGMKGM